MDNYRLRPRWLGTQPSEKLDCVWISGSAEGTRHVENGQGCQDRIRVAEMDGVLAICVADGVSGAKYGAVAAEVAVTECIRAILSESGQSARRSWSGGTNNRQLMAVSNEISNFSRTPWPDILQNSMIRARDAILDRVALQGDSESDYGTTLSAVVVQGSEVHCAQVGDGMVIVWKVLDDDHPKVLVHDLRRDEDPSVVRTLGQLNNASNIIMKSAPTGEGSALLVTTDGLAPLILTKWTPPVPGRRLLKALVRELDAGRMDGGGLDSWLASPQVVSRTDDDTSLVIASLGRRQTGAHPVPRLEGPSRPAKSLLRTARGLRMPRDFSRWLSSTVKRLRWVSRGRR